MSDKLGIVYLFTWLYFLAFCQTVISEAEPDTEKRDYIRKSIYYPPDMSPAAALGPPCPCPGCCGNNNNYNSCPTCGLPPSPRPPMPPPMIFQNPCSAGDPALTYSGSPLTCSVVSSLCPKSHWCHIGATVDTTCCCPGAVPDPCQLPLAVGAGYGQLSRYYYNMQSGQCQQFVYRGMMGNQNCFPSINQCQSTCRISASPICLRGQPLSDSTGRYLACSSHHGVDYCGQGYWCHYGATAETTVCCPGTEDPCALPCALGQGTAMLQRWFYDLTRHRCERFIYKGLQGNQNNFFSSEDCESKCRKMLNPCAQGPPIQDPSGQPMFCGNYRNSCPARSWCHFGADSETTVCCPGAVDSPCSLELSRGFGNSALSRWYYDTINRCCSPFSYSGVGGNQNNFLSREDCEQKCTENPCLNGQPAMQPGNRLLYCAFRSGCGTGYYCHVGGKQDTTVCCPGSLESACSGMQVSEGVGDFSLRRWYFDSSSRQCREFNYKGTKGNPNNFPTQQDCQSTCTVTQNPCAQPPPPPAISCSTFNKEACPMGQWCHFGAGPATTVCCAGAVMNPCNEPMTEGSGVDNLPRYYYNSLSRQCQEFIYRGTMGNQNNFLSQYDCEQQCNAGSNPCPINEPLRDRNGQMQSCTATSYTSNCPSGYWCHIGATTQTTGCCPNTSPNACTLPESVGQGNYSLPRFRYDAASRQCVQFSYSGIKGNENNFLTLYACQLACGEFTNPCIGQPATTPTGQVVFCSSSNKEMCPVNFWCHVGATAQTTLCCPGATNPCSVPLAPGTGTVQLPRYFYNADTRTCQQLTYFGLGGNQNNFETLRECESACPAELCALSLDQGTCNTPQTRYAYDRQQRTCVSFTFNGCGGNLNNFVTMQECLSTCGGTGYRRRKA